MMTADEFIKRPVPFRCKKVVLPCGGEFYVKEMTPDEIDQLHEDTQRMTDEEGDKHGAKGSLKRMRHCFAYIIAECVYDPTKKAKLFSPKQAAQIASKPMGYLAEVKRLVEFACLGIGAEEIDDPNV
jgi:hypothetical protein